MMFIRLGQAISALSMATSVALVSTAPDGSAAMRSVSPPSMDAGSSTPKGEQVAVFSGGCFWGVQAVFQHMKGVVSAVSGYTGGEAATATYEQVSRGNTGHAESVRVVFDSSQVSFAQLLQVFFSVAHDPTELNFQGPDHGTQYRSAIWYTTPQQKTIADTYIAHLTNANVFRRLIVTQVNPVGTFFQAEAYHQDYATIHPRDAYIVINDAPKIVSLKKQLPELYRDAPALVSAMR